MLPKIQISHYPLNKNKHQVVRNLMGTFQDFLKIQKKQFN